MRNYFKVIFAGLLSTVAGSALAITQGNFFDLYYEDFHGGVGQVESYAQDSGILGIWGSGDQIRSFDHIFLFRFDTKAVLHSLSTQLGEGYNGIRAINSYEFYKNASIKDGEFSGTKLDYKASLSPNYDGNGSAFASMSPNLTLDQNTIYGLRMRGEAVTTYFWTDAYFLVLPPVPEPETYAMLLAGIGIMGAIARRKLKSAINAEKPPSARFAG